MLSLILFTARSAVLNWFIVALYGIEDLFKNLPEDLTDIQITNKDNNGIVLNGATSWTFPEVKVGNSWTVNVWYKQTGEPSTYSAILSQIHPTGHPKINLSIYYYRNNTCK